MLTYLIVQAKKRCLLLDTIIKHLKYKSLVNNLPKL